MTAISCSLLAFALALFAASPLLHGRLHAGSHAPLDDGCAVAVFAAGVEFSVPDLAALPPDGWTDLAFVGTPDFFVDSPRYLLRPERGPPGA